ncbi:MAG: class I tRNA ligase family protein [Dehalococcoidia bacterium]
MTDRWYITTPIYYVNDRPHIGNIYTTTVADVVARYHRMHGDDVFFLTGTDEHAAKVVESAARHGLAPREWADRNADAFQQTFAAFGISNDDFIRTSQPRHIERVQAYLSALLAGGDIYRGYYEGWYDPGQEEYVPEARAAAYEFRSPVTGTPLVRRSEENWFFRLSRYSGALLELYAAQPDFVRPDSRRNEVIGRVREGLNDIPISRTGGDWGIAMPGDEQHRVYVWIDALFNYLTAVDTPEQRYLWPADVHLIAKDILWFHAVIWPALLLALGRLPGYDWVQLPRGIYAHSFWVSDGRKMSKSLGNFVELERLQRCVERFGLDAVRYYLVVYGPMGIADRDFTEARLQEVYTSDLANAFGNLVQRTTALIARYGDGRLPIPGPLKAADRRLLDVAMALPGRVSAAFARLAVDEATAAVLELVAAANRYAEETAPWLAAKAGNSERVVTSLYHLAEAARVSAWHLTPFMPSVAAAAHRRLCGEEPTSELARFGAVAPGARVTGGPPLFPRLGNV